MKHSHRMLFVRAMATSAIALTAVVTAAPALAQDAATTTADTQIAGGALGPALERFANATGYQLLYPSELVAGKSTGGVSGRYTVQEGLARLLSGTGLTFRVMEGRTIQIISAGGSGGVAGDGERVLGPVRVEGAQGAVLPGATATNGTNGSRDVTATEGTGSFTSGALTIGSKVPKSIKDLPQTVSVLTSERMEQQNVTDFNTALDRLPGVTLVQSGDNLNYRFYSRGFEITSIQVDGGAPMSTLYNYYPQIDMAQYDHVELLRGASGLFNGYGDPSGTVNLVRKKPLNDSQYTIEGQVGSWKNYRVVADATTPLAFDGALRGRFVTSYQNNEYFYDTAKNEKLLLYGVAEYDLSPTTLLTAGISYTSQNSVPWYTGLPRYYTGDDLHLPRTTSLAMPWSRYNLDTTELFGGIEQKFAENWNFKLNLTKNKQVIYRKYGYASGAVDPVTLTGTQLQGSYGYTHSDQLLIDATLNGAFKIFGQTQRIVIGVNHSNVDGSGNRSYDNPIRSSPTAPYQPYPGGPIFCVPAASCPPGSIGPSTPPVDVFDFDPNDPLYTEPRATLVNQVFRDYGTRQWGAYANLDLTAFDRLHLALGFRFSRYEYNWHYDQICTEALPGDPYPGYCTGLQIGDIKYSYDERYSDNDVTWPPNMSLSYDITRNLRAYVGYADIYQSQANYLGRDGNPIDPETGANVEIGLKWQAPDSRLNASFALYRIKKSGRWFFDDDSYVRDENGDIFYDPDNGGAYYVVDDNGNRYEYGKVDDQHYCCYVTNLDASQISQGFDIEINGELARGWQISAGYTYSENKYKGADAAEVYGPAGQAFFTRQPKHSLKLWTSYDFGAGGTGGALSRLALSGGLTWKSSAYNAGRACPTEYVAPFPDFPTILVCDGGEKDYSYTTPAYAVVSGRIDYRLNEQWALALNLDNITDTRYYATQGTSLNGNWYGAPRSFTLSLRAKW